MEYCSVVRHDNLTQAQSNAIERLQMVALKIILGSDCPLKEDGNFALVFCTGRVLEPWCSLRWRAAPPHKGGVQVIAGGI